MKQSGCMYCEPVNEKRDSLMLDICEFNLGKLFLFKDQKNKGRCILAFKDHRSDLTELSPEELTEFMQEVMQVANALHRLYHPDKLNYGSYADVVKHLHIHIVPKYIGAPGWGGTFSDDNPKFLSDAEYQEIISAIKKELGK